MPNKTETDISAARGRCACRLRLQILLTFGWEHGVERNPFQVHDSGGHPLLNISRSWLLPKKKAVLKESSRNKIMLSSLHYKGVYNLAEERKMVTAGYLDVSTTWALSCVTLRPQVERRDPRKWCRAQAVSGLRHCRAYHTPLGEEHLLVRTRSSCPCQAQTTLKTSPQWASESNVG